MKKTYEDNLEEHFLIDLHELLVPLLDLGRLLAGVRLVILGLHGVVAVMLRPLDHLPQDSLVNLEPRQHTVEKAALCDSAMGEGPAAYILDRDGISSTDVVGAKILEKVLDEHGALGDAAVCVWVSAFGEARCGGFADSLDSPTSMDAASLDWSQIFWFCASAIVAMDVAVVFCDALEWMFVGEQRLTVRVIEQAEQCWFCGVGGRLEQSGMWVQRRYKKHVRRTQLTDA